MRERSRVSRLGAVIAVAVLVIVLSLFVLVYLGSQVTGRLGGPCPSGQQGVSPGYCTNP